jgi:alpha-beta hydrolase superfamily lysophospholipase
MEISGAIQCTIGEEKQDDFVRDFMQKRINISPSVYATLIYKDLNSDRAVLYIHGFADCFCNSELYNKYMSQGYAFYALDLREHGRSITSENNKFYIEDVEHYFKEIDLAIYTILKRHNKIVLHGFSMGGLAASLYMDKGFYRDHISALVLASPLLRFNTNSLQNYILKPIILGLAKFFPFLKYNVSTNKYKDFIKNPKEDVDPIKVKHEKIPLYLGWMKAVYEATQLVAKGLNIKKPILVMSSDKTIRNLKKYQKDGDLLLDVEHIEELSFNLGRDVSYFPIKGAVHDIYESSPEVKELAFDLLFGWLKDNV